MESTIILTQISKEQLIDILSSCVREELKKHNSTSENSTEELLKIEDAVKLLRVSKVTLYKWRKKGILPYYRISSRIYFKKHELLETIKKAPKFQRIKY